MVVSATYPVCEYCKREFRPGESWTGVNFCRAVHLVKILLGHPGLSTWELAQEGGILYSEASKAMLKARDWGMVSYEEEEREAGGKRYRYKVSPEYTELLTQWIDRGLV